MAFADAVNAAILLAGLPVDHRTIGWIIHVSLAAFVLGGDPIRHADDALNEVPCRDVVVLGPPVCTGRAHVGGLLVDFRVVLFERTPLVAVHGGLGQWIVPLGVNRGGKNRSFDPAMEVLRMKKFVQKGKKAS